MKTFITWFATALLAAVSAPAISQSTMDKGMKSDGMTMEKPKAKNKVKKKDAMSGDHMAKDKKEGKDHMGMSGDKTDSMGKDKMGK